MNDIGLTTITTTHAENILFLEITSLHPKIVFSMGPKLLVNNRIYIFSQVSFATATVSFSVPPQIWSLHKICIAS